MVPYKTILGMISTVVGNTLDANRQKKAPYNINVRIDNVCKINSMAQLDELVGILNSKCSEVRGLMSITVKNYEELQREETGVVILECKVNPRP